MESLEQGDGVRLRVSSFSDPRETETGMTVTDGKSLQDSSFVRPAIFKRVPRVFRFDNAATDATGLSFDYLARACIIMSTVFLGPALLKLSSEAANCPNMQDCEERVFGMKPSSLLTNIAMLAGFLSAITMPLMGAIVDHTNYRKQVGAISAYTISVVKGIEIMISVDTWLYVAFLQVFTGVLYSTHLTVTYAYMSELSKDPIEQTKYNSYYFVVLYVSILLFIAEVMLFAFWFKADDVGTARISQIITCISTAFFFGVGWTTLFTNRPPSTQLQDGQWLLTAGFIKLNNTSRHINREIPAMRILMWSVMCSESAIATLVSIATTFMVHFLGMDSIEVGTAFLIILVMGIPGAKFGESLALRASPRVSAMTSLAFFIATTMTAALVLRGPQHKHYMNLFSVMWGTGLGWLHPQNTTMFISLTPSHSQTEYMGIYNFAQSIIGWLPPLVFTIMNENGVEMNYGLASLNIFFFLAFVFLCLMGPCEASAPAEEEQATAADDDDASFSKDLPLVT
jgi:UMF1 family MFS transporter